MEINLQIKVCMESSPRGPQPRACDYGCPFLDDDYNNRVGFCFLFKEPCPPKMAYGDIEFFTPCNSCRKVIEKTNH